jgi:hypothetical protein
MRSPVCRIRICDSEMAKLRHTFMALHKGQGLLSPCNWVIQQQPQVICLHQNGALLEAIQDIWTILCTSIQISTQCKDLVLGWPDFIGIINALSHSVGGVVVGELSALPPTVFRFQWPSDISQDLVSFNNPKGKINNSDLDRTPPPPVHRHHQIAASGRDP